MVKVKVIAAVRDSEQLLLAAKSEADMIFMLTPNITKLKSHIEIAHSAGKKLFVHIDLAEGIGKDEYGIRFVSDLGVDGIISTRTNMIKIAKKLGMYTVQRFFIVDSHSVDTTIESAKTSKADMIEIMPGTVTKVIARLKMQIDIPIIAGGLIESAKEIDEAMLHGASGVSTGKQKLWERKRRIEYVKGEETI